MSLKLKFTFSFACRTGKIAGSRFFGFCILRCNNRTNMRFNHLFSEKAHLQIWQCMLILKYDYEVHRKSLFISFTFLGILGQKQGAEMKNVFWNQKIKQTQQWTTRVIKTLSMADKAVCCKPNIYRAVHWNTKNLGSRLNFRIENMEYYMPYQLVIKLICKAMWKLEPQLHCVVKYWTFTRVVVFGSMSK